MICSSRRPGPQGDVDVRVSGRVEQRGHELVGGHVLAQEERAGLELAVEAAVAREEDERPRVARGTPRPRGGSRSSTRCRPAARRTRPGPGRSRPASVIAGPRSSRTMSATNASSSAAGLSAAQPRIALLTSGRRAVSATSSTIAGEDQREDQELEEAADAGPPRRPAGRAARRRRAADGSYDPARPGRVGVGIVRMRLGARVARSRGRPPERIVMCGLRVWSGARGMDERRPARASSSSCRMIAAASRSTRAR